MTDAAMVRGWGGVLALGCAALVSAAHAQTAPAGQTLHLLAGSQREIRLGKPLERIATERKKAEENLQRIEAKLANESFTSRAPENVGNAEREKAEKARALIAKLDASAAAMKL